MPGQHHRSQALPWALVPGGAVGALIRYAAADTWPQPHQLLVSTTLTVGVAFTVATFVVARGATGPVLSFVLGVCAGAASLSAYAVLTVSQPALLSIAFLTLTPAAALGGLLLGLLATRAVTR
ncbi:chromosome condensation protein CrcB [Mycobacterium sp. ZZG]